MGEKWGFGMKSVWIVKLLRDESEYYEKRTHEEAVDVSWILEGNILWLMMLPTKVGCQRI